MTTFDGKGHLLGDQTLNVNGNVSQAPLTGTYTVNPDCTGIAEPVGAGPHSFVIIAGGKEMDLMDGNVQAAMAHRIFKVPTSRAGNE